MTTTTDEPTTGSELMRQFLPHNPFVVHTGIELVKLEAGHAELALPFHDDVVTIGKVVHGGALATLIDTAAMTAAWAGADVPERLQGATVSLSVSYLAPAEGEDVTATARVVRRGGRLTTVQVDVRTPGGEHVATALVTYQIG
jgi:uncharacterized protein (TIGR00369 family)